MPERGASNRASNSRSAAHQGPVRRASGELRHCRQSNADDPSTYPLDTRWHFTALEGGFRKVGSLVLRWELYGDSITDDYLPDETSANELLELWLASISQCKPFDDDLGFPHLPIRWYVDGADSATFEAAPPISSRDKRDNFTTSYTHPLVQRSVSFLYL